MYMYMNVSCAHTCVYHVRTINRTRVHTHTCICMFIIHKKATSTSYLLLNSTRTRYLGTLRGTLQSSTLLYPSYYATTAVDST